MQNNVLEELYENNSTHEIYQMKTYLEQLLKYSWFLAVICIQRYLISSE